jgi:hypothetical protein
MAADHKFKSITTEGTENTDFHRGLQTIDHEGHEGSRRKTGRACVAYQSAVLCGARWVLVMRSCQESWSSSR